MLAVVAVIAVTSAALILGAWLGAGRHLSERTEGLLVAGAGGALIVSVMSELIEPAVDHLHAAGVVAIVVAGAVAFTLADAWIDRRLHNAGGFGLLLSVTFDGVPENLALGVSLIDSGPMAVAALAGSIFLSNLPEAAGGAKTMRDSGRGTGQILGLWTGAAILLSAAAVLGWWALDGVSKTTVSMVDCVAAGAILASLSTEIFPKAGERDPHLSGVAVAVGLSVALLLGQLGGG